jgi:hypothetical protein
MRPRVIMARGVDGAPIGRVREVQLFNRRRLAVLGFVLVVAASPGLARAQQESEPTYENGGLGAAAALCSLLYGPVKVVWAISGLIVGGLAYPLSGGDADIMMKVINTSVRGDYVVTPSHLRGEQPLEFFGRDPDYGT